MGTYLEPATRPDLGKLLEAQRLGLSFGLIIQKKFGQGRRIAYPAKTPALPVFMESAGAAGKVLAPRAKERS